VHIFIGVSVNICINIYVCTVFFLKKLTLCFVFFITYAAPLLLSGVGGLPGPKKKDSLLAKKASSRVANILFDHMIISCVVLRCIDALFYACFLRA
jgi:hypothetical protein